MMTKNLFNAVIVLLIVIVCFFFICCPVQAADFRGVERCAVETGEVVDDDLYIAGNEVTIEGTVNGDVWAAGSTVTITGDVNGNIVAVGQTVIINSEVSGSIIAAAQTVTASGKIGRSAKLAGQMIKVTAPVKGDIMAFGGRFNLSGEEAVSGDLLLATTTATIKAPIEGNLKGGASSLNIGAPVAGDVHVQVDKLIVTSTGAIEGNLEYTSFHEAEIKQGGTIGGSITQIIPEEPVKKGFWASIAGTVSMKILSFAMALIVGIISLLLFPRRVMGAAAAVRARPWQSLGWGALLLIATPAVVIVAFITVVGIPAGLITGALYIIALYLSPIPVALLIGWLILRHADELDSTGIRIGALALGLAVLLLLRLVPFLGFFVSLFTVIFGLGTIITSFIRIRTETALPA